MKYAICNINIQIPVPDNATEEEVQEIIENYELPEEYVEDTFEFVKTYEETVMCANNCGREVDSDDNVNTFKRQNGDVFYGRVCSVCYYELEEEVISKKWE